MCESRAEGGHRCKTHLEQDRIAVDNKIHEAIMSRIPERKRPNIAGWKPNSMESETALMVALHNPAVVATQEKARAALSSVVAKQSKYEEMLHKKDYDKFLTATSPSYKNASDADKAELVNELKADLKNRKRAEVAYEPLEAEYEKVDSLQDAHREALAASTSQTFKMMFYQTNPEYREAREDFNYSPEGMALNRERSMISVTGEIMNKTERKNLDKKIAEEKNPIERAKLNIELHRQQYLSDAETTVNQVGAYKDRPKPLNDGERVVIGGKEQWPATTIISESEAKRIIADEHKRGVISPTVNPNIVLAKKGLYVEGSFTAKNQLSKIEGTAKRTLQTRAEKLEEALFV